MTKQIFVNLAITDANKSKEFFSKLGFKFNPIFTDEKSLCMIIGENIYAMLLVNKFFKNFIPDKEIADTSKCSEVLVALSANSRQEVDNTIKNVLLAGGNEYRTVNDYGWMYQRSFQDLDGHIWEMVYMDENKIPEDMKNKEK
jgi:uncharacterized protein